jgi:uncharacterized protein YlbG (UPF0298 family)
MVKRKSIIVYFRSPRAIKKISKIADIAYYHKKRKYAVCYINETDLESKTKELKSLKMVKYVDESQFDTTDYQLQMDVK